MTDSSTALWANGHIPNGDRARCCRLDHGLSAPVRALPVPPVVVCAVCIGQPVPEEALVIGLIHVMGLQPKAGTWIASQ
jgi:hypothetical protein